MKRRLAGQRVLGNPLPTPADVVRRLTAVQAQDYKGALWAVGLRAEGATESTVEMALADRTILRTWPMRGTLHLVAAEDVWWMLPLLTPRAIAGASGRHRQLGLGPEVFSKARRLLEKALRDGGLVTRDGLYRLLDEGGISPEGQRGIHIIGMLAQQGVLCHGPREGKQFTFVLLEEWAPRRKVKPREEALAELARRYFSGHGPATVRDFAWWAGLAARDAQQGLDGAAPALYSESIEGTLFWGSRDAPPHGRPAAAILLPPFDELLVGYEDRSAVLDPVHAGMLKSLLSPVILEGGRVVGIWNRTRAGDGVHVVPRFFGRPGEEALRAVRSAARRYGEFLEAPSMIVGS